MIHKLILYSEKTQKPQITYQNKTFKSDGLNNLTYISYSLNDTKNLISQLLSHTKNINHNDIILILNSSHIDINHSDQEIEHIFKSFNSSMVISSGPKSNSILDKYYQDKSNGRCGIHNFNLIGYIGYKYFLTTLWKQWLSTGNQVSFDYFIINQCKVNYPQLMVDEQHKLFNLSKLINNDKSKNKYPIVLQLKDNKQISNNPFFSKFLLEICLVLIICLSIYLLKPNIYNISAVILFLIFYLEYQLSIKFLNIPLYKKMAFLILEVIHLVFVLVCLFLYFYYLYQLITLKCNFKILFIINFLTILTYSMFFLSKRCILSHWSHQLIKQPYIFKLGDRIKYFSNKTSPYSGIQTEQQKKPLIYYTQIYIDRQKYISSYVLLLNVVTIIYYLANICKK